VGAIVVGVDYTGESQAALEMAIEEAGRRGAILHLVHHVHIGSDAGTLVRWQEQGAALLARALEQTAAAGIEARTTLEFGSQSVAAVILAASEDPEVELIVIGSRKRTRVGKALMGSDAQQVIVGAEVPVLCVKDLHGRGPVAP
jgi:nucleotide-binding universal stress UspA family protein